MVVAFKELAGSPVEYYGQGTVKAQRRFLCAWESRGDMLMQLLGSAYNYGAVIGAMYPGKYGVKVCGVKVEPFESRPEGPESFSQVNQGLNSYDGQYALLTVDYELFHSASGVAALAEAAPGTFLGYHTTSRIEEIPVSPESLAWDDQSSASLPLGAAPMLRVPIISHHVTWHRVTEPPWQAIRAALGSINSREFLGAPAETVLFDSASAEPQFVNFDDLRRPQYAWCVRYVFRERALRAASGEACGWNHAFRGAGGTAPAFDRLVDAAGTPLYREADFSGLFQLDASRE